MSSRSHQLKGRYTSFESVLHELLDKQIEQTIADRGMALLNGGARKETAADTAAAYFSEIGFVQGLRAAQQMCQEIAHQLSREG